MASTASEIIATAKTEAEAARQSALSSLSGMSNNLQSGYDTQKQATTDYYTNMMNNLQNAYNKDAKSAYANSMTNRQALSNSLNRMGLTNSGYGVSQLLGINSQYSKNLADLQNTLATNKANTGYQQQQALADLYSNYTTNKNALDQYLYEAGQKAYDNAFDRRYQAEQDAIANALQEQYNNYLMYSSRSGGGSGGSGGSGGNYNIDFDSPTKNYAVNTDYWQGDLNSDTQYGTFKTTDKNGVRYQPNNVGGNKLTSTKKTVGQTFGAGNYGSTGASLDNQNVWYTKVNGKKQYYVWDGSQNRYIDVTNQM